MTHEENQIFLIRYMLGLNPIHDPVASVKLLLEQGREAFEAERGPACEHAHTWIPKSRQRRSDMTQWQHMVETYPQDRLIEMLNQRGDEGWELACVNWEGDRAEVFYKRPRDEPKTP